MPSDPNFTSFFWLSLSHNWAKYLRNKKHQVNSYLLFIILYNVISPHLLDLLKQMLFREALTASWGLWTWSGCAHLPLTLTYEWHSLQCHYMAFYILYQIKQLKVKKKVSSSFCHLAHGRYQINIWWQWYYFIITFFKINISFIAEIMYINIAMLNFF